MSGDDRLLSAAELAAIWGVSPSFVRKRCALPPGEPDHLPCVPLGSRRLIRASVAARYIADRETAPPPPPPPRPASRPAPAPADRIDFFD